jgi:hypothetical protein
MATQIDGTIRRLIPVPDVTWDVVGFGRVELGGVSRSHAEHEVAEANAFFADVAPHLTEPPFEAVPTPSLDAASLDAESRN